jgi:hypothetical protein
LAGREFAILSSGFVGSCLFEATCICAGLEAFVHRSRGQNLDTQKEIILGPFCPLDFPETVLDA